MRRCFLSEASLAAHQQIAFCTILPCARGDGDRLLEADGLDVADDLFEDPFVAVTRIQDVDPVDGNHLDFAGAVLGCHAALLSFERAAMP